MAIPPITRLYGVLVMGSIELDRIYIYIIIYIYIYIYIYQYLKLFKKRMKKKYSINCGHLITRLITSNHIYFLCLKK